MWYSQRTLSGWFWKVKLKVIHILSNDWVNKMRYLFGVLVFLGLKSHGEVANSVRILCFDNIYTILNIWVKRITFWAKCYKIRVVHAFSSEFRIQKISKKARATWTSVSVVKNMRSNHYILCMYIYREKSGVRLQHTCNPSKDNV